MTTFELSEKDKLAYSVGALLYSPAIQEGLAEKIAAGAYEALTSLAFCLEDSIRDDALRLAEEKLKTTLNSIKGRSIENSPLLFVRIRTPEHLKYIHAFLKDEEEILTGYILPKFDLTNAEEYKTLIETINAGREKPLYFMPILESLQIADLATRRETLLKLKKILDGVERYILNVRVGGNDLCNLFGIRRSVRHTIYDIGVVRDILSDILNVFSRDYVVSGPVWEYFGKSTSGAWAIGLQAECEKDRANGFIGKTAIHPAQLPVIAHSMAVSRRDFEDAKAVLGWDSDSLGVAKGSGGERMNEVRCHLNWAKKILILAKLYGIRDEETKGRIVPY